MREIVHLQTGQVRLLYIVALEHALIALPCSPTVRQPDRYVFLSPLALLYVFSVFHRLLSLQTYD